jgi:thimet oligopeptidase
MARAIIIASAATLAACGTTAKKASAGPAVIRYDYKNNEITELCDQAIAQARRQLDEVAATAPGARTLDNTLLKLEESLAVLGDATGPLTFMGYVSRDADLRKEGEECEKKMGLFGVEIMTRKDLYNAIKDQKARNRDEARLLSETKLSFEKHGMGLDDAKLAELRGLQQKLTTLETEFSANLNNDTTSVELSEGELEGVPASTLARFKKSSDGKLIVTTKYTDYEQVMENAKNSETRRKMLMAYTNRAGEANTKLLEEAVQLRQKIASLLGYKTWADYRTSDRMAKSGQAVEKFLNNLKTKLRQRNQADLAKLLKFKKELDPQADHLDSWDLVYLAYQLKKRDYQLDDEQIREYFPSDFVIRQMFGVYSQLLGVRFEKIENADVWAPDVSLYKILDGKSGALVAYFYTDFTPREGKYGHAAAFPLISGRRLAGGGYSRPVAAIVANLNPPSGGKPSLLNHGEVETIFHEFGHIMHQTLTRAPYASLSGSGVKQDFVEAPSQMLENWVWERPVLNRLSGYYKDTSRKLPPEILKKMLKARDFNEGYYYTRQLLLGLFDLDIHTAKGPVDVTRTYDDLYEKILGVAPLKGNHFVAGFGHMMGGYDAGYYGYLWSQVFAEDMFTRFQGGKLLSSRVGAEYRKDILEPGNMKDPLALVTKFLGRKPNQKAFLRKLGIRN